MVDVGTKVLKFHKEENFTCCNLILTFVLRTNYKRYENR